MLNVVSVILNSDLLVYEWQYKCLQELKDKEVIFLIANEDKNLSENIKKRNYLKYFFYYCINLFAIKKKKIKIKFHQFKNCKVKNIFFYTRKNFWQELTQKSITDIISFSPDFIYKCGMDLLHINKDLEKISIISHHHGDPSNYRGRPAGFYEILKGESVIGQMVQVISNKLDAGRILSYGESKIYRWSYKKTLDDSYKLSPIIFQKALINLEKNIFIDKDPIGRNYKLPSNYLSIFFIWKGILSFIYRILYGLFYEKSWQVAYLKNFSIKKINEPSDLFNLIDSFSNNFKTFKITKGYDFYADPFILNQNIIFEGLNSYSRKGNLLLADIESNKIIENFNIKSKHLSYPYTNQFVNKTYIYPDSGSLKKAIFMNFENQTLLKISMMENFRSGLIDPSVIEHNGLFYLFANYPNENCVLRLWVASNPSFNDANEHKCSPVCITPIGGRSGGRIFKFKNKIYRFGQNYGGDYGNGLILFEINLNENYYSEVKISSFKFNDLYKGPHTIDFSSNLLTWDFYTEKFNFFAGIKRIIGKIL